MLGVVEGNLSFPAWLDAGCLAAADNSPSTLMGEFFAKELSNDAEKSMKP